MIKENCAWTERPWHLTSIKCNDSWLSEFTVYKLNVMYPVLILMAEQGKYAKIYIKNYIINRTSAYNF